MTFIEFASRTDYITPHALAHAVELERQARATRNSHLGKALKLGVPMTATGKPGEASFDFLQIYA